MVPRDTRPLENCLSKSIVIWITDCFRSDIQCTFPLPNGEKYPSKDLALTPRCSLSLPASLNVHGVLEASSYTLDRFLSRTYHFSGKKRITI